jgi:hypothetical protein
MQYYTKQVDGAGAIGMTFPTPGLGTVSSAAIRQGVETFLENKTLGFYVQEEIGWRDRAFLTLALRGDDNSAFGADFNFASYPKASATWVVLGERRGGSPMFSPHCGRIYPVLERGAHR